MLIKKTRFLAGFFYFFIYLGLINLNFIFFMKKITLWLFVLFSAIQINAQVSSYTFAQSSGTYTPITGGTVVATATTANNFDSQIWTIADGTIPFNFNFNNANYTGCVINSNGYITFGTTPPTAGTSSPISSTTAYNGAVSAWGGDLNAGFVAGVITGELSYVVEGTAPNREFVIQFANWRPAYSTSTTSFPFINFQIRLAETSNVVKVVYGATGVAVGTATTAGTRQIGLRGATSADFNNRLNATTLSFNSSTAGTTNTSSQAFSYATVATQGLPNNGLTYSWTPPTCPSPTTLTTTAITSSSANLAWNVPFIAPSSGYEYVVSTTNTVPTGAGTSSTSNSVSLTGLTSGTIYYVFVRSNCGTEFGVWTSLGSFVTQCVGVTDFIQNFDNTPTGIGVLPVCWSSAGSTGNVYNTTESVAPMSPANRLYMNISATTTAFATLPPVSNLQAETHRLRFKAYATAAAKKLRVGYFTTPGDASTFVVIEEIDLPSTAATTATEFTVIPYLSAVPGVNNLVFSLVAGTATTVYIDDVKWEVNSSCVEPTALNVLSVTNGSAQLSWANGGAEPQWQVQYGLNGFTLGTGTIVSPVTTNPYTLTGLTANTTYQYYVRGECSGPEFSSWAGPFTFKTLCNGVTAFTENFDTTPTGVNSLPDCWSRAGSSTTTYNTTGSTAPMSPSNRLFLQATTANEAYAILPPISNLQAGTNRLRFKAFTTLSPRSLVVGYMTNPSDVSTFVALQTFNVAGTAVANTQEYVVYPTGVPAGVSTLAIKNAVFTGATTTIYIDDVAWEVIPACSNPTGVSSSGITSTSATIAWTSNPTDVSWEIEYGAPGFTLGTGTIVPASTNPFTLTGLASATTFQYYVRAICAGPVTSANSLPGTFTTLCAPFTPAYVQDFATFPALCWRTADAGNPTTGPTGTAAGIWLADGYINSGTTGAIKVNLFSINRIGWMISPVFNLSAGGYEVKYDVAATNWNLTTATTMGSDDQVNFLMSTDGGVSWTSLEVFNAANTPTNLGATKVYNISTVTSPNVIFAYYATDGPVDDTADYDFFVDNFKVDIPPVLAPVCATNIVASQPAGCGNFPLSISWNATPAANGYRINVGTTTGGTNIANNVDLGSALTYNLATPNVGTTYYYTVIPYNTVGSATGCVEQSFLTAATGCYCAATPTSVDGTGITNVQVGTTNFPNTVSTAPVYNNSTATPVNLFSGILNNLQISFNTSVFDYNTVVWIDLNNDFNFDSTEIVFSGTSSATSPNVQNASFTLSPTAPLGSRRMRIVSTDALQAPVNPCYSGAYGEVVDFTVNITAPPACLSPTSSVTSAITSNSATFTWSGATATNYEIVVQAAGTGTPALANNTGLNVAATTYNAAGLNPNSNYEYYVRSECTLDTEFGAWSGPYAFTTLCNPYSIPYFEGFETGYVDNATVAGCLSQSSITGSSSWTANNTLTTYNRAPRTGAWNSFLQYGNEDWLYIPVTLVAGTSYTASAYVRQDGATAANSNVGISYGTTNTSAGMTNVIVAPTGIIDGGYQLLTGNFVPATSGVYFVGIKGFMNGIPWYISLDDVSIIQTPICPAPTGNAAQTVCGSGTLADLVVTGSSIVWYDAAIAGNVLPNTTALVSGTTYYASQNLSSCINGDRLAVTATVTPIPATPTGAASQTFCNTDNDDLADLVVSGTNLVWYDAATGGNVLPTTTLVTATTYYVASVNGTCESSRLAITTTLDCSPAPCLTATNGQWPTSTFNPAANCDGYAVQQITTCGFASEYSVVTVASGQTYTFASSIATDIITLSADAGVTSVATGTGSLTWVSTVSGDIRFYTHTAGCGAQSTCRIRTVTCGVITNDSPDYANLQFPSTLTFAQGGSGIVYGQIYEGGLTDVAPNITGQAPGITAWVGISPVGSNTNPNTWTNWVPATWNSGSVGNNDEYQATIGATLLPGTYYYATRFRLNSGAYVYGGIDSSNNGNFWNGTAYNSGVLTVTPPPAPANDNCSGALAVTVNPALTCTAVTAGTLVGATASTTDAAACGGTEDDDVWFSFVATATSHQISLTNIAGSTTDLYHSLWTGADCATLTLVPGTCSDPNTSTPAGLTIGQTYYIRVYSFTATAGQTTTFNVCVGTLPAVPANDACANAFVIGAIPYTNTQDATAATNNAGFINACSTDTMNDGVWYTVVGNGNDIVINITGVTGWDPQVGVYTGSCGTFTCVGTVDVGGTSGSETYTIAASAIGTTYYINVGHFSGSTNSPEGPFTIGVTQNLATDSFDDANFAFYPNPVNDVLNLSYTENITKVQVINLLGQEVRTNSMDATLAQVDMSNLPSGTYLVKVTANDKVKTIKVIKQ